MSTYIPKSLSNTIANSRALLSSTRSLIRKTSSNTSRGEESLLKMRSSLHDLKATNERLRTHACKRPASPSINFANKDQAMETTLHMLMHDIRSPINNITSLIDLLKANHELPESLHQFLDLMIDQSERVRELTQFHTLYQQLESGSYQPDRSGFDLFALLQKIQRQLQALYPTNGIEVQVDGQDADLNQPYPFYADAQATELMLQNLIQNAVEASPSHASVGVEIQTTSEGGTLRQATIAIHNQGMIPKAIQPYFFEKFVTSGKKKGTGLGTYIALRVAQAHGGTLSFATSRRWGTTLNVDLPNVLAPHYESCLLV